MSLSTCTVTLTTDKAAISGAVVYEPLPGQVVADVFVDCTPITAQASGTSYIAALKQGVKYRLKSARYDFPNTVFTTPATSTANLQDLIESFRSG